MSRNRDTGARGHLGDNTNLLINGDFSVWQRGIAPFTVAGYTADRFKHTDSGTGWSVEQGNDDGRYLRVLTKTTSSTPQTAQIVEVTRSQDMSNRTYTLSFEAKSDVSSDITIKNYYYNGTDSGVVPDEVITLTPSFTEYSYTFTVPAIAYVEGNTNFWTRIAYDEVDAVIGLKGIKLEEGSVATPFEAEPYVDVLAKCQRYYYSPTASFYFVVSRYSTAANQFAGTIPLPVPMRTTPTATFGAYNPTGLTGSPSLGNIAGSWVAFLSGRDHLLPRLSLVSNSSAETGVVQMQSFTADAEL